VTSLSVQTLFIHASSECMYYIKDGKQKHSIRSRKPITPAAGDKRKPAPEGSKVIDSETNKTRATYVVEVKGSVYVSVNCYL
jgi:hypothetical protein